MLSNHIPPPNVREEVMMELNADELNYAATTCVQSWIHTLQQIDVYAPANVARMDKEAAGDAVKAKKYLRFQEDKIAGDIRALERVLEMLEEAQKAAPGGLSLN